MIEPFILLMSLLDFFCLKKINWAQTTDNKKKFQTPDLYESICLTVNAFSYPSFVQVLLEQLSALAHNSQLMQFIQLKWGNRGTQQLNKIAICSAITQSGNSASLSAFKHRLVKMKRPISIPQLYFVRDGNKVPQAITEHDDHTQNVNFVSFEVCR